MGTIRVNAMGSNSDRVIYNHWEKPDKKKAG
jgi:hypothetical protein